MKIKKILLMALSFCLILSCVNISSNTAEALGSYGSSSSSSSSYSLVPPECIGAGTTSIYTYIKNGKKSPQYAGQLKISWTVSNNKYTIIIASNNSNYKISSCTGSGMFDNKGNFVESYSLNKVYKNNSTESVEASYKNGSSQKILANFAGFDGCYASYNSSSNPSLVISNNSNGTNCIGNGASSNSSNTNYSGSNSGKSSNGGSWRSDSNGWWYQFSDGSYPANKWVKIGSNWYYFLENGYMDYSEYRDGCWLNSDGSWNTAYSNGTWKKDSYGWWYEDNGWYPINQSLWIDGTQWYFDKNGYLYTEYDNTNGDFWTNRGK